MAASMEKHFEVSHDLIGNADWLSVGGVAEQLTHTPEQNICSAERCFAHLTCLIS